MITMNKRLRIKGGNPQPTGYRNIGNVVKGEKTMMRKDSTQFVRDVKRNISTTPNPSYNMGKDLLNEKQMRKNMKVKKFVTREDYLDRINMLQEELSNLDSMKLSTFDKFQKRKSLMERLEYLKKERERLKY